MNSIGATLLRTGVAAAALAAVLATAAPAEAAVCRARMSGEGTGMGVAGQGTTKARAAALSNWARNVEIKHGKRFADSAKAQSVRYDCRQGAILEAKCVATAVPCR